MGRYNGSQVLSIPDRSLAYFYAIKQPSPKCLVEVTPCSHASLTFIFHHC